MNLVFPALEARFKGSTRLKRLGRKLYVGLGGLEKTLPYMSVARTDGNQVLTFGKDHEEYTLTFNGFTSHEHSRRVLELQEAFFEAFDSCDLNGAGFSTIQMMRVYTTGPLIVNGVYQFTAAYELYIQRTVALPLSRGT